MPQDPRHAVREWLLAEHAGQPDAADRAFARAAAVLPRLQPSARFADAVLARLGGSAAAPDPWASWWLRGFIGAALASVGVLVARPAPATQVRVSLMPAAAATWCAISRAMRP